MNHWKIVTNIYNKVIDKCPIGTYQAKLKKTAQNYALRMYYGILKIENSHDPNGTQAYTYCPKTYSNACKTTAGIHVRFLNFQTEEERFNAFNSYFTKFARFCQMLDESTKLAPYMDDYLEPWTDKRFKEYFGLTDIEWQLIDTVIKD